MSWVDWFLAQPRAKFFVRIDEEYLATAYNWYGIKQKVNHFQAAYELLRKSCVFPAHGNMKKDSEAWIIEQQAEMLYGLIHARYLMTKAAWPQILEKCENGDFLRCPRVLCRKAACLPYGVSHELCEFPVKMFCPSCSDVYNVADPVMEKVDGAFFGPSWIHCFLAANPQVVPKGEAEVYVPKIFGVKVNTDWDDGHDDSSTT